MYRIIQSESSLDTPSFYLRVLLHTKPSSVIWAFLGSPDSDFMISTPSYPYPVNYDKSSARRVALQPHIYSPSESRHSPRNAMYPHLHISGSPSPNYIYSGYEQYYPKDSWVNITPSSWPSSYPFPPRRSLPETTINPKVTILPQQPLLVSDIDTPSSISSHSVLTPSSPFAQHDVGEMEPHDIEFDEFDCDEEEGYLDSDFADEMEGIDDMDQEPSPVYSVSAPHVVKSTSALEGALGDTPSSSYSTDLTGFAPADRRLSASVPGYASASHRSSAAATHQRSAASPATQVPEATSHHVYTQRNPASSTSLFASTSPPPYNPVSSSSLAGAFVSPHHPHPSRPTHHHSHSAPLPILQPQPIRPIPPIPIADLTSSASERSSPEPRPRIRDSQPLRTLSPLPLLCQPVSDAIRYQLKASPANSGGSALVDVGYDEDASESMCQEDLVTASGQDRFAPQGLTFCQEHHPSTGGTGSIEQKMYSCGRIGLSIRWQ